MRQQLKELEEASRPASLTPEQQRETDGAMSRLTTLVAQMYQEEQEHRVHETELSAQLAMEQSRWVDFNSRLDELERLLPVAK